MAAVYLDHNATTPADRAVREAMEPWLARPANASSTHTFGRAARAAVVAARTQVAGLVGASPDQVVFTSGGTEADDLALRGLVAARPGAVVISAVEHAAVRASAQVLAAAGRSVIEVGVDGDGQIDLAQLERIVSAQPVALVSVMWANNETGVITDLDAVVACCRARGIPVHSDAIQAAGKVAVDFRASGLAALSLSAHKLYGPQGIGALVVDRALTLAPQLAGGGQQGGVRGGTEPVAAIVGFGTAAELAADRCHEDAMVQAKLRSRLERSLTEVPQARIIAISAERLPNTIMFTVAGIDGEALLLALDQSGYAVSSGSACASADGGPSHVLTAMGLAAADARAAVRVSLGRGNTAEDVDGFMAALRAALAPGTGITGGAVGGW